MHKSDYLERIVPRVLAIDQTGQSGCDVEEKLSFDVMDENIDQVVVVHGVL